jgi:hypothetical protein
MIHPRGSRPRGPEACHRCEGPMQVLRAVSSPDEIAEALHAARPPPRASPRGQLILFVARELAPHHALAHRERVGIRTRIGTPRKVRYSREHESISMTCNSSYRAEVMTHEANSTVRARLQEEMGSGRPYRGCDAPRGAPPQVFGRRHHERTSFDEPKRIRGRRMGDFR